MEVRYDVYLEDENEDNISDKVDFDAPRKRLELIFSHLTEEEKEILEKYNFKYEYTEDNKIKLMMKIREYIQKKQRVTIIILNMISFQEKMKELKIWLYLKKE